MKLKIWLFSAVLLGLISCQSIPPNLAYLQDMESYMQSKEYAEEVFVYEPTIKVNDNLLITVSSPIPDQTQVAQFNLPMNTALSSGETRIIQAQAIQTYIVDVNGDINFPIIGKIPVVGLLRSEVIRRLTKEIEVFLPEPIVNLQIITYRITVLGEVGLPGRMEAINGRMTIFEALGAARDITIFGDRHNVLLIRENKGKKELHRLDLTQASIIDSPYYYLQQNDVIYVEPNQTRKLESSYGRRENYNIAMLSVSLTAVSVLITLAGFLFNMKR